MRATVPTSPCTGISARCTEGTAIWLRSRFARVRVHTAPMRGAAGRSAETLLIEWPESEPEPTKYWLATVDEDISFPALVDLAKMRCSSERGWPSFPPHDLVPPGCSKNLPFLMVTNPAEVI